MRTHLTAGRRRGRRLAAVALTTTLLAGLAAGCSDGDDGSGGGPTVDASSIRSLLDLVPDTEANRASVDVALYADARDAAGLDEPGDSSEDQLHQLGLLTSDVDTGTGVGSLPLAASRNAVAQFGKLRYLPSDVDAEIYAGQPPDVLSIGIGDFDPEAVLDAAELVDGATRTEVSDVDTVSWLEDSEIELELDTPIGDLPGQAGRVALPSDDVLVYAHTDATTRRAIERAQGSGKTLGDDEDLAAVADALDDLDVHAAHLSTEPVTLDRSAGSRLTPEQIEGLELGEGLPPYRAYGVGAALGEDGPLLVIVLQYADNGSATDAAVRLDGIAEDGRSAATGQPWSDVLGEADVHKREDTRVEVSFPVENPTLWFRLVAQGDTLLATS